jgi:hypothetical protein
MKKLMTLTICAVLMSCSTKNMDVEQQTEPENRPYFTHLSSHYQLEAKEHSPSGSLVKFEIVGDGIDNDGDGEIDELEDGMMKPCDSIGTNWCELGTQTYVNGTWGPCIGAVYPVDNKD